MMALEAGLRHAGRGREGVSVSEFVESGGRRNVVRATAHRSTPIRS